MQCNIHHLDNNRNIDYWCLAHKSLAVSENGQTPVTCTCRYKARYDQIVQMSPDEIQSLTIIYPDLNHDANVKIYLNQHEFNGTLKLGNSLIDLKDYGGMLLSKLNRISLESSQCPYCGAKHTDNGKFAYTPHAEHLCIYCGHLYKVSHPNIGNELALYLTIPDIALTPGTVNIDEKCTVEYDLLHGTVLVNGVSCQTLQKSGTQLPLVVFLNEALKNEY